MQNNRNPVLAMWKRFQNQSEECCQHDFELVSNCLKKGESRRIYISKGEWPSKE